MLEGLVSDLGLDLRREFETAARSLEATGLSSYEAKAYVALVAMGFGTADEIADLARIPRTSSYKVLKALEDKAFASSTTGRPIVYRPEDPAVVYGRIKEGLDETFAKLELLHEVVREKGSPQLIFTITGKPRVLDKIAELLDEARESFIISSPAYPELRGALAERTRHALSRGVSVTVIAEPGARTEPGVRLVRAEGLVATDVVSDESMALIAAPDLSACGFSANPFLAQHLRRFLDILLREREGKDNAEG
jgi:sugar-specific transcriptional regulator TrmB